MKLNQSKQARGPSAGLGAVNSTYSLTRILRRKQLCVLCCSAAVDIHVSIQTCLPERLYETDLIGGRPLHADPSDCLIGFGEIVGQALRRKAGCNRYFQKPHIMTVKAILINGFAGPVT